MKKREVRDRKRGGGEQQISDKQLRLSISHPSTSNVPFTTPPRKASTTPGTSFGSPPFFYECHSLPKGLPSDEISIHLKMLVEKEWENERRKGRRRRNVVDAVAYNNINHVWLKKRLDAVTEWRRASIYFAVAR